MSVELDAAAALMRAFAERTGLTGDRRIPVRYLWTDAFAVCNFVGLARETGDDGFLELGRKLVTQVHATLGAHRDDDPRRGALSGLAEHEAREHPTWGGLRIGKRLPERRPGEPFDPALEWERDGQYFHYLTKWMHALDQIGRATADGRYVRWARELAQVAHAAFTRHAGPGRMVWKMSVDLARPLVASMGQHDPLDAFVTYSQLRASSLGSGPDLAREVREAFAMCERTSWPTDDPLGIGGLLTDASRVAQLCATGAMREGALLVELLASANLGLVHWVRSGALAEGVERRLAFRELGLAIGLAGVRMVRDAASAPTLRTGPHAAALLASLDQVTQYLPLGAVLVETWRDSASRRAHAAHRDIDDVMLATSLASDGFLRLA